MFDVLSGVGGSVTMLILDANYAPVDIVTFDVTIWRVQVAPIQADVSHVAATGTRSATKQYQVTWSFDLPPKKDKLPEAVGVYAGRPTTVWFRVGAAALWHCVSNTQVAGVTTATSSTGGVVRMSIQGKDGDIEYYTTDDPSEFI